MHSLRIKHLPYLLLLLLALSQSADSLALAQSLQLTPCDVPGIKAKAQCGNLEVFENRVTQKGRRIKLKVVVSPAASTERLPDPVFYLAGGPGSSAIEDAPGVVEEFKNVNQHRDLVFVDQRGTGSSHPLDCEFYRKNDPQSTLGSYFPLDDVKKCREQLERDADLTLYTTPIAMDDLDDVRAALGYERINLVGGSYGTRASMVYLRQHPDHVRVVILQGVSPTNHFMPYDFPQSTERALQGVISECVADQKCNQAFPNLRAEVKAVLEKLLQGPVEVNVPSPGIAASETKLRLSRDLAAEAIRYMLYSAAGGSRVPLVLHQAASGNFVPLTQAAVGFRQQIVATGSNGMYLSVTCAEDLPWIKAGEGERLALNTFLGDYRLRQQREACALWPRGQVPSDYSAPVQSAAPVLILTGEWDPVTPPKNGDYVARHFPNSLHIVVPHGGHGLFGLEGLECLDRLSTQFVEEGTTKNLDQSCVKTIRRRGFDLK
ncbi:MAG TPA: alpha/beta hydrolase [Pyrinomonadaceae bacterium]|nr:alpha/beta hydrolase [Pyrinomonadaceae bacterium]